MTYSSMHLSLEDWVLEVNVTPNRGDCLSVMGIARELAALFGRKLNKPEFTIKEEDTPVESVLTVEILSPEGCPRYSARIMNGIVIKKSPFSMRSRLFSLRGSGHQQCGGHHQLCHAGIRPASPRL